MNLKDKRVFISGGAGVIGSALVEKLLNEGAIIMVGDLKPMPKRWDTSVRYWQGDLNYITQPELLDFAPQVFFHLAATFERSVETYEFWHENYHHNVRLSNHLISLLKDSQALEKVVFASSYLIYNPIQYNFPEPAKTAHRLKETDPIYPRNLCGTAKLLHEMELNFLAHWPQNHYKTVSARIFRVYGKNSKDIVSRWIRSLLNGETLTVYKPEGLFDYIYADDVAQGLYKLATTDTTGIVNLGRDNARRVSEVLEVLKKYFPVMKTISSDLDIPYEASQANMDNFRTQTGWAPATNLEDAIPQMIEFEKKVGFDDHIKQADLSILISSISQKIPMVNAVKKASAKLGNIGNVIGADINAECLGSHFVDSFYKMKKLSDLHIKELVDYCISNNIRAIIPSRDGELEYFASNKDLLSENGISVMVSGKEQVEYCIDKLKFYGKLKDLGYPVIQTSLDISEISSSKMVIKERFGAGSISIGINIDKNSAESFAQNLTTPIYQPFISGKEFSVDVYIDKSGKAKGCVVRSRDLIINGESQITTTVRNEKLESLCSEMSEKLGLYGHLVWQILVDDHGNPHIIECNSRFGGASTLSIESGLDSFYWFLLEANGTDISGYPFIRSRQEKKQIRYKADMII